MSIELWTEKFNYEPALVLIYCILSFCLWVLGGSGLLRFLGAQAPARGYTLSAVTGMLAWGLAGVMGRSIGCSWPIVHVVVTLVFVALACYHALNTPGRAHWRFSTVAATAAWFAVHGVIASSLFWVIDGGISSPWRNNYGDLAFHLGMISSLVSYPGSVHEFHLFSDTALVYPFLINFITAMLWSIAPTLAALKVVFVALWLWCAGLLWLGFRGNLLAWAVVFGGSSYTAWGLFTSELIPANGWWTSLLASMWVPQRGAWAGIAVVVCLVRAFTEDRSRINHLVAGALLGICAVLHLHSALAAGIFLMGLVLLNSARTVVGRLADAFTLGLSALLATLPVSGWFLAKTSALKFIYGFHSLDTVLPWNESLWVSFEGWVAQWWHIVLSGLLVMAVPLSRGWLLRWVIALFPLLLLTNAVLFALWRWDQVKLISAMYVLLVLGVAIALEQFKQSGAKIKAGMLTVMVVGILSAPSLYETYLFLIAKHERYQIFESASFARARQAAAAMEPGAEIACIGNHNSWCVLTGHPLFVGYEGTLWSHGITSFPQRKELLQDASVSCPLLPQYIEAALYESIARKECYQSLADGVLKRQWVLLHR